MAARAPDGACVVFDLDGTLVDSAPMIRDLLNGLLADASAGPPLTLEAVRPHVTAGGYDALDALLAGRCGPTEAALVEFRSRYARSVTAIEHVYPGAHAALRTLRAQGFRLAVFSNKTQVLCDKVLADVGLAELFDAVVGTRAEVPGKPDPTGYHLALALSGGRLERSCLVGDSESDVGVALAAKVPLVFAQWGYGEAPGDAPIARAFDEVPTLVQGVLGAQVSP